MNNLCLYLSFVYFLFNFIDNIIILAGQTVNISLTLSNPKLNI
jgi:hypothetical protein